MALPVSMCKTRQQPSPSWPASLLALIGCSINESTSILPLHFSLAWEALAVSYSQHSMLVHCIWCTSWSRYYTATSCNTNLCLLDNLAQQTLGYVDSAWHFALTLFSC